MLETVLCPHCGATAAQQDAFCSECGKRITQQASTVPRLPPSESPRHAPETRHPAAPGNDESTATSGARAAPRTPPPHTPPPVHLSPHPAGASRTSRQGFFAGLFDFRFIVFITPKVIKFVYAIITILIALAWLIYIVVGFKYSPRLGFLVLIFGPVIALFLLMLYRITLELVMVIFRIGADVHVIKERSLPPSGARGPTT